MAPGPEACLLYTSTTFSTELTSVKFDEGDYKAPIEKTYEEYLDAHKNMYKGRDDKFVCLMDLALMAMKKLKAEGKLADQEAVSYTHLSLLIF